MSFFPGAVRLNRFRHFHQKVLNLAAWIEEDAVAHADRIGQTMYHCMVWAAASRKFERELMERHAARLLRRFTKRGRIQQGAENTKENEG